MGNYIPGFTTVRGMDLVIDAGPSLRELPDDDLLELLANGGLGCRVEVDPCDLACWIALERPHLAGHRDVRFRTEGEGDGMA